VHRHLVYDTRVARLMVTWLGCMHWTLHNWMQEAPEAGVD